MNKERYDRDYANEVGERLQSIQDSLGYSNTKMAEDFEVTIETYRKYKNGEACLTFDRTKKFYDKTPIDIWYLFNGKRSDPHNFTVMLSSCEPRDKDRFLAQIFEYMKQLTSIKNKKVGNKRVDK